MKILLLLLLCIPLFAFAQIPPKESCAKFSKAVVLIQIGNQTGTGFIATSDGYILTAGHVVSGLKPPQVANIIRDGKLLGVATLVGSAFDGNPVSDYAVLKIEQTNLPFLELASGSSVPAGTDITVIGHPTSTQLPFLFCLQGTIAAIQPVGVLAQNVLFYQGVSVKGLSGSPIISRDTGKVIGVVTLKLTGITQELASNKDRLMTGRSRDGNAIVTTSFGGMNYGQNIAGIIDVLDQQLANGLGAAIGIEMPAKLLRKSIGAAQQQKK